MGSDHLLSQKSQFMSLGTLSLCYFAANILYDNGERTKMKNYVKVKFFVIFFCKYASASIQRCIKLRQNQFMNLKGVRSKKKSEIVPCFHLVIPVWCSICCLYVICMLHGVKAEQQLLCHLIPVDFNKVVFILTSLF